MVGMLQIITYLLCVYLVFKAVEIFTIGLASQGDCRIAARFVGILAILAAIGLAAYFVNAIDTQAQAVASSVNRYLR
uniref:Uncharacterized protein n=1 Tax=Desulfobacca acetoxidans TaxID=60893 RepID=A0A7V4GA24_9BACT